MKNLIPLPRKCTSKNIGDKQYNQGDKSYIRRDYADGSVDLITYSADTRSWLYETYAKKKIMGIDYDFEYCLSSPCLCALYFVSATIVHEYIRRKEIC